MFPENCEKCKCVGVSPLHNGVAVYRCLDCGGFRAVYRQERSDRVNIKIPRDRETCREHTCGSLLIPSFHFCPGCGKPLGCWECGAMDGERHKEGCAVIAALTIVADKENRVVADLRKAAAMIREASAKTSAVGIDSPLMDRMVAETEEKLMYRGQSALLKSKP